MVSVIEGNGVIVWGKEAECPKCGEMHETFTDGLPETGGIEICDDCLEGEQ